MTKNDPFDIEKLRLREAPTASTLERRAAHERKRAGAFAIVPQYWIDRLANASHAATLKLALHLLSRSWKSAGPITVSNTVTANLFNRRTKWLAVRELEQLGLVQVECRGKAAPVVTVLHTHQRKGRSL